jgi:hypothetical protein
VPCEYKHLPTTHVRSQTAHHQGSFCNPFPLQQHQLAACQPLPTQSQPLLLFGFAQGQRSSPNLHSGGRGHQEGSVSATMGIMQDPIILQATSRSLAPLPLLSPMNVTPYSLFSPFIPSAQPLHVDSTGCCSPPLPITSTMSLSGIPVPTHLPPKSSAIPTVATKSLGSSSLLTCKYILCLLQLSSPVILLLTLGRGWKPPGCAAPRLSLHHSFLHHHWAAVCTALCIYSQRYIRVPFYGGGSCFRGYMVCPKSPITEHLHASLLPLLQHTPTEPCLTTHHFAPLIKSTQPRTSSHTCPLTMDSLFRLHGSSGHAEPQMPQSKPLAIAGPGSDLFAPKGRLLPSTAQA